MSSKFLSQLTGLIIGNSTDMINSMDLTFDEAKLYSLAFCFSDCAFVLGRGEETDIRKLPNL